MCFYKKSLSLQQIDVVFLQNQNAIFNAQSKHEPTMNNLHNITYINSDASEVEASELEVSEELDNK
jgi:uncharacterized membrane protein (UPF0127 family)